MASRVLKIKIWKDFNIFFLNPEISVFWLRDWKNFLISRQEKPRLGQSSGSNESPQIINTAWNNTFEIRPVLLRNGFEVVFRTRLSLFTSSLLALGSPWRRLPLCPSILQTGVSLLHYLPGIRSSHPKVQLPVGGWGKRKKGEKMKKEEWKDLIFCIPAVVFFKKLPSFEIFH